MRLASIVPALLAIVSAPCAHAAVWDGDGATRAWSDGANWAGGTAPAAGASLTFAAVAASPANNVAVNDLAADTAFNHLTLDDRAYTDVTGSRVALNGDLVIASAVGGGAETIWSIPLLFMPGTHDLVLGNLGGSQPRLLGAITAPIGADIVVSGGGQVVIAGSGANQIDGAVTVNAGYLRLAKSAGIALGGSAQPIVVGDGTGPAVGDAFVIVTAPQQIHDAAIVELRADGGLAIEAPERIGTVRRAAGGPGPGLFVIQPLTCGGAVHGDYVGPVTGGGAIIVQTGTLNLREVGGAWTGDALADNGRLALNGTGRDASAINNGSIGGRGTITGDLSAVGSVIAPGEMPTTTTSAIGTLTVGGTVAMNAGSRLQIQALGGATAISDRVVDEVASGGIDVALGGDGVNPNGAQLVVTPEAGYVGSAANPLTIIDSPSVISGRFAGLPDGAIFSVPIAGGGPVVAFQISYDSGGSHNVTLTDVTGSGRAGTTTSVVGASATSLPGQSVTFTATIGESSLSVPTGTLYVLLDGYALFATPQTVIGNTVTFTIPPMTVGAHQVTAMYNGDMSFLGSQGSVTHTVVGTTPPPPPGGGGEEDGGGGSCGKGGGATIAAAALLMLMRAFGWRRRC